MWLVFRMKLQTDDNLLYGYLDARDGKNEIVQRFKATSGLRGHQSAAAQSRIARGPIPACKTAGIKFYAVATRPLDRKSNRGIAGDFFHILPDPVKVNGRFRSELGIHKDANVPGSAGCIVLPEPDWQIFRALMRDYAKRYSHISLIVEYSVAA